MVDLSEFDKFEAEILEKENMRLRDFVHDVEVCLGDLLVDEAPGTGDQNDDPLVDLLRRSRELLYAVGDL